LPGQIPNAGIIAAPKIKRIVTQNLMMAKMEFFFIKYLHQDFLFFDRIQGNIRAQTE